MNQADFTIEANMWAANGQRILWISIEILYFVRHSHHHYIPNTRSIHRFGFAHAPKMQCISEPGQNWHGFLSEPIFLFEIKIETIYSVGLQNILTLFSEDAHAKHNHSSFSFFVLIFLSASIRIYYATFGLFEFPLKLKSSQSESAFRTYL